LTLNRPDALNALNPQMTEELYHYFTALYHDHSRRIVVMKANGRALRTGLVSEVVAKDKLAATAQSYIDDMLTTSPMGLRLTKQGYRLGADAPSLDAAMALEDRQQVLTGQTEDHPEAIKAFFEKRSPKYQDK